MGIRTISDTGRSVLGAREGVFPWSHLGSVFSRKTAIRSLPMFDDLSIHKVDLGGGFEFLLLFCLARDRCGFRRSRF